MATQTHFAVSAQKRTARQMKNYFWGKANLLGFNKEKICIWVSRREGKRLWVRGEDARGPDDEDEGNEDNGGDDGIHKR